MCIRNIGYGTKIDMTPPSWYRLSWNIFFEKIVGRHVYTTRLFQELRKGSNTNIDIGLGE